MAGRRDEKTRPVAYRLFVCGVRQADLGLSVELYYFVALQPDHVPTVSNVVNYTAEQASKAQSSSTPYLV